MQSLKMCFHMIFWSLSGTLFCSRFSVCANAKNLFLAYADPVMILTITSGYQKEDLDIGVKPQTHNIIEPISCKHRLL